MKLFGFEVRRVAKPMPPTRFLGDLIKVDLSPGDVCILLAPGFVSKEQVVEMQGAWRAAVGDDVTLLVLGNGMKLGVLSPPQAAEVQERIADEQAVQLAVAS